MKRITYILILNFLVSVSCYADDELIQEWSNQAVALMQTGNISSPINKSALYYLARIEKISPHHEEAKKLRTDIIDAYESLAKSNGDSKNQEFLSAISSDLEKYSTSNTLDESTSSARLQRFLKNNYPSVKTEMLAELESEYISPAKPDSTIVEETTKDITPIEENIAVEPDIKEEITIEETKDTVIETSPEFAIWKKTAEKRIQQARLSLPKSDSALHYLAFMEKEAINSEDVTNIRNQIASRYIGLGNSAIKRNQIEKGNKWLGIGEHIQNLKINDHFSTTYDSVDIFLNGPVVKEEQIVKTDAQPVTSIPSDKINNKLLAIPEKKLQSTLLSQTLEISIDNSEWINPFDKKRKKAKKKKVELSLNENTESTQNKAVEEEQQEPEPIERIEEKEAVIVIEETISKEELDKINKLYELAKIDISNDRLMKPANKNAYEKLLKIEGIQKEHPIAVQLRQEIYDAYVVLIETAISVGLNDKASLWLESANEILNNQEKTKELNERLNNATN